MTKVCSGFDHNPDHIHIPRVRSDRAWVDLEPTPAPLKAWGWDIAAAVAVLMFCALVWPVIDVLVAL